ncbi:MAG: hypothetical protein IKI17_00610 [Oscillospiraceae bacterium]|nr:hypothetical protein [Oscillospiraceae bacterium]
MAALCSGEAERQIVRIELYGKLVVAERGEAMDDGGEDRDAAVPFHGAQFHENQGFFP